MLVKIANREEPYQTASSEARLLIQKKPDLLCLSGPFRQATSV